MRVSNPSGGHTVPDPSLTILYVGNPTVSAAFYRDLVGYSPIEASPTFVLFAPPSGPRIGLWSRHTVEPAAADAGGELAFHVADAAAVRAIHDAWRARGLPILQSPTEMDFGFTFVARDPDGHRLRVFAPAVP
jgi:catechol 2,3-dioxygenase-like lactoylglutathione lyase family enzyme